MNTTINGLKDSISVLEQNKNEQPSNTSDILYNKQEVDFEQFYHDGEYIYSNFDFQSMHMDAVTLLSMPDEKFILN